MSYKSNLTEDILVSIIILNYNGGKYLIECISSILQNTSIRNEIILIDNDSKDSSHLTCKEKFSEIILIQNEKNMGLGARNIGLKLAKGNFIVFLDFDTVVEKNWLTNLFLSYKKHGDGLYQPKLLEKKRPDVINSCGNMINIFGLAYSRGKGNKDKGQYDNFSTISYASGACTFSSSEVMKKIGFIDELLFAYHDDVDYGWRGLLLGIQSYYEPSSIVYHYGSPTLEWSAKKFFLLERNRWICLLTLYSSKTLVKIFPLLLVVEAGVFFFFLTKKLTITKLQSYFSLFKLRKNIKEKRKEIEKIRQISDSKVIESFVNDFCLPTITDEESNTTIFQTVIKNLSIQARKIISA